MAAAVSDYAPLKFSDNKIKKDNSVLTLKLKKTDDILKNIVSETQAIKIGFALETEYGEKNALNKLKNKQLDYIILNYANEKGAGFESDTNHLYVYSKNNKMKEFKKDTKFRLSQQVIEYIIHNEK